MANAGVVCARGLRGLDQADLDALTAAVGHYLATRCGAPSQVLVPRLGARRGERRTYHCGLALDHDQDAGHRWPPEGPLIVAWCDWPRRG